jgi:hypothetical protein
MERLSADRARWSRGVRPLVRYNADGEHRGRRAGASFVSRPPSATLLESATEHHRSGDLVAARRLYAEVLRAEPAHDLALFRLGLQRSPFMDGARFAHCIEQAYRSAWRTHCRVARR